jgi:hypothetical protein
MEALDGRADTRSATDTTTTTTTTTQKPLARDTTVQAPQPAYRNTSVTT